MYPGPSLIVSWFRYLSLNFFFSLGGACRTIRGMGLGCGRGLV